MNSNVRRNTNRRNKKNRTRRRGGGPGLFSMFSSKAAPLPTKPKTYDENLSLCKKDLRPNCDNLAKGNNYVQGKDPDGRSKIYAYDLFPIVSKPTKFKERDETAKGRGYRPSTYYYYPDGINAPRPDLKMGEQDPFKITTTPKSDEDKIRRYKKIGYTVLPKYDKETRKIIVGYGKTDTPLTDEDVHDRTYEELEEYIDSLPDLTEEDINNEYIRQFNSPRPGVDPLL